MSEKICLKAFKFWTYTHHLDRITETVVAYTFKDAYSFLKENRTGDWILESEIELTGVPVIV